MIRTSMCSIGWRHDAVEAAVQSVGAAGYDGIELWGPHIEKCLEQDGTLDGLKEMLTAPALAVPMVSPYFDFATRYDDSIATARRFIDYATDLNAPLIRLFTGGGPSDQAGAEVWETLVRGVREVCGMGLDRSIGFAIEVHDNHLHDTTATTLHLLQEANMPNLCVNLDIFNLFQRGEDPLQALDMLFPHTRILHLKNWTQRDEEQWVPVYLDEGPLDYGTFLARLRKLDYDGFVSVEWFGQDPDVAARHELGYLRELLAS